MAKQTKADDIESLSIAILVLMDCPELTPWERSKAEEIHDLCNQLQEGEPT